MWTLVHVILNSIRVSIYLEILFKKSLSSLRGKSNDLLKRIPLALDSTETWYKPQVHYIPIFGNEMMLTYTCNTMSVLGLAQKLKVHFDTSVHSLLCFKLLQMVRNIGVCVCRRAYVTMPHSLVVYVCEKMMREVIYFSIRSGKNMLQHCGQNIL